MNKYFLPPRADLANKVLMALHIFSVVLLAFAEGGLNGEWIIKTLLVLFLLAGLIMRHPVAYGVIMVICFIGIGVSLKSYEIGAFITSTFQLMLALYIRKHLYTLAAAKPAS